MVTVAVCFPPPLSLQKAASPLHFLRGGKQLFAKKVKGESSFLQRKLRGKALSSQESGGGKKELLSPSTFLLGKCFPPSLSLQKVEGESRDQSTLILPSLPTTLYKTTLNFSSNYFRKKCCFIHRKIGYSLCDSPLFFHHSSPVLFFSSHHSCSPCVFIYSKTHVCSKAEVPIYHLAQK